MHSMKPFILITIIFFATNSLAQTSFDGTKIRKSIMSKLALLPAYSDTSLREYLSGYDTLFKKATEAELYELTNHANPFARRSAMYVLIERYSPKAISLLTKNSGDTAQYFLIQYGCILELRTFVDELLFYLSPMSGWDRYFKLTAANKELIKKRQDEREIEIREYEISHQFLR